MEQEHTDQIVTNDLSFAAYLMMRGCALLDAKKLGRTYKFILSLNGHSSKRLKVEYANSESTRFDAKVRDLKRIVFSGG
jgi:hypothetical protein